MIVLITNLTDAPGHGKGPTQIDIYNKTLNPGQQIKLPADLVSQKIRALAEGEAPIISIGNLPPWYVTAKTRKGVPLTAEERQKRMETRQAPPKATTKEKKVSSEVSESKTKE